MKHLTGRILSTLVLVLIWGLPQLSLAKIKDNTYCPVKVSSDDADNPEYRSLRRNIEEGFNRVDTRACVEKIEVMQSVELIILSAPLTLVNDTDLNCMGQSSPSHPLCMDDWAMILDGGAHRVTLDVSNLSAGLCAIDIRSHNTLVTNIEIRATTAQLEAGTAICDNGSGNTLDVSFGDHPRPLPTPTPTPTPIPTAQPTPSPTPTPDAKPNAPTELSAEIVGGDLDFRVQLTWTDHANNEEGFKVERATVAEGDTQCGPFEEVPTLDPIGPDGNQYDDKDVTVATSYCYRVFAFDGAQVSDYSNVAQVSTPDTVLEVPSDFDAVGLSEEAIFLDWFYLTPDIDGFRLERGDENCSEGSFAQIALLPAAARDFNDSGLTANTTYCYRIMAFVGPQPLLDSDWSEPAVATTLEPGATPVPTPTPDPTPSASPSPEPTSTPTPRDTDGDGFDDDEDNCPEDPNPSQHDTDGDNRGDQCDDDIDGDGVSNDTENSQGTSPFDADTDDDSSLDGEDNCPTQSNPGQEDNDGDSIGDACDADDPDADADGDGRVNSDDNCPNVNNPDQADADGDGLGDACDLQPGATNPDSGGCSLFKGKGSTQALWFLLILALMIPMFFRGRIKAHPK